MYHLHVEYYSRDIIFFTIIGIQSFFYAAVQITCYLCTQINALAM